MLRIGARQKAIVSHLHPSRTDVIDGFRSIEESAWKAAAMECQQAMLQLQQVEQTQHNATQLNGPEQLVAPYHPAKAMAFRQLAQGTQEEVKGFVEAAEIECWRRDKRCRSDV